VRGFHLARQPVVTLLCGFADYLAMPFDFVPPDSTTFVCAHFNPSFPCFSGRVDIGLCGVAMLQQKSCDAFNFGPVVSDYFPNLGQRGLEHCVNFGGQGFPVFGDINAPLPRSIPSIRAEPNSGRPSGCLSYVVVPIFVLNNMFCGLRAVALLRGDPGQGN
jgi:hypothetical protein